MSGENRITREELLRFLRSQTHFTSEKLDAMVETFGQYDRETQDAFLRNLPPQIAP